VQRVVRNISKRFWCWRKPQRRQRARSEFPIIANKFSPLTKSFDRGDSLTENGRQKFVIRSKRSSETKYSEFLLCCAYHFMYRLNLGNNVVCAEKAQRPSG
jgi:hypothetical protein